MYHIMYNDGTSRCQVALTVVPYERLRVQFAFIFFLFCFILDGNYGIEILWLKTKIPPTKQQTVGDMQSVIVLWDCQE